MTPIDNLGQEVFFKREDLNLTGSAKDRALISQIQNLRSQGFTSAVISSSGNAAISAQYFCHLHHIPLTVFVSPHISPTKLAKIRNYQVSSQAISDSIKYAHANHAYLLRQSTDTSAIIGYQAIGREIIHQLPHVTSIFVPVGSGTTLLGIAQSVPESIKIYAAQPASNPTICRYFQSNYTPEPTSPTDSLTVKYLPLKSRVTESIKAHQGSGIIISAADCILAQNYLISQGFTTSAEGALAYAAYQQAKLSTNVGDTPLVVFTGSPR